MAKKEVEYDVETKNEKFIRLGEGRVRNVLKYLRLVGNLANTASYEYSQTDVEFLLETIADKFQELKFQFRKILSVDFKFPSAKLGE